MFYSFFYVEIHWVKGFDLEEQNKHFNGDKIKYNFTFIGSYWKLPLYIYICALYIMYLACALRD